MEAIVILIIKIGLTYVLAYVGYILIKGFDKKDAENTWKDILKFLMVVFLFLFLLDIYSVFNLFEQLKQ